MGNTRKGEDSGGREIGKQEISFGYVECVMPVSCPSGNNEKAVKMSLEFREQGARVENLGVVGLLVIMKPIRLGKIS